MKPVSYQSMPSVISGHPSLVLDRMLSTSALEKSGFPSTGAAVLNKHVTEQMGTRFYCFYCNNVSFSEADLNAHLKQHTAKYPFKCPHCGQGYMRRLCLVKHIERLHSKALTYSPSKTGTVKTPHVSVTGALSTVPTAEPSPPRPVVRVTVPTLSAPGIRLGKDEQMGKTLNVNGPNATNGSLELLSPMSGLMQHNRALTVSLPEEVTIPAGCLVELVEVKTVNGTKELKLRLVAQQENQSVIKDTRTAVPQNTTLGKQLSSTLNYPNTMKSMSLGACTINRKPYESKSLNLEHHAVVNLSKNLPVQNTKDKCAFKRKSRDIINLEHRTEIPNKTPRSILNPVREGNSGAQRQPLNLNAALPSAAAAATATVRFANRLNSSLHAENTAACASPRAVEGRNNLIQEHSKSILPVSRAADSKRTQDVSLAVKVEPGEIHHKESAAAQIKKEASGLSEQRLKSASSSSSAPLAAAAMVRHPAILARKDDSAHMSFSIPRSLNGLSALKMPTHSCRTNSKILACSWEGRSSERPGGVDTPEPEGFPVISSVFSLSQQQPEDVQGSIQPLVMALCGVVMDRSNSSGDGPRDHIHVMNSMDAREEKEVKEEKEMEEKEVKEEKEVEREVKQEKQANEEGKEVKEKGKEGKEVKAVEETREVKKVKELATAGCSSQAATKDSSSPADLSSSEQTSESTQVEESHKSTQCSRALNHSHVKHEEGSTKPADTAQSTTKYSAASGTTQTLTQLTKSQHDISSKFLTVSLKRVQFGTWKKNKKGLKVRVSKCKTQVPTGGPTNSAFIHPMPLREDQLVKRPGPNQPVVVLNHPKPRTSAQGPRTDTPTDTGASQTVPKCQILKMRLSKVMGQKYEVMGCTVRVCP